MKIWQCPLPKKFLVKSERTARTLRGQLRFRTDSVRIRWGTVKTLDDVEAHICHLEERMKDMEEELAGPHEYKDCQGKKQA